MKYLILISLFFTSCGVGNNTKVVAYDTIWKDTTIYRTKYKDTTIVRFKDSILYTYKKVSKDTVLYIPLFIPTAIKKYITDSANYNVDFTIKHRR